MLSIQGQKLEKLQLEALARGPQGCALNQKYNEQVTRLSHLTKIFYRLWRMIIYHIKLSNLLKIQVSKSLTNSYVIHLYYNLIL